MTIDRIFTEYQESPLGLDEKKPRFSWLLSSDRQDVMQKTAHIRVWEGDRLVWDSKVLESDCSTGIAYAGEELQPKTAYKVTVEVTGTDGEKAEGSTSFETGLMDPDALKKENNGAFCGARWIGAPRYTVSAKNRGVFFISTEVKIPGGKGKAGLVFGADDERLLDPAKNEYGIAGENYIRYELDFDKEYALNIFRVGYARGDSAQKPFARVPLVSLSDKKPVITRENAGEFHTLEVEIDGDCGRARVDGIPVDAVEKNDFAGKRYVGRQLNPRGDNDVITYPRLCSIGFSAGENKALFKGITVRNWRAPGRVFVSETPAGNLYGEKSIFSSLPVEEGCFALENGQVTADPSEGGLPMLRTEFVSDPAKSLLKARLYITSRGTYDAQINGKEVTENLLTPGITQYDKRIDYQTYDITDLITPGDNAIGVTLGSGWWSEAQTFTVRNFNYFGDKNSLLAMAKLTYTDGSTKKVVTDPASWKVTMEGPCRFASHFAGEIFDAGKKDVWEGYSRPGFDDSSWLSPVEVGTDSIPELYTMPKGFGRCWPAVNEEVPEIIGEYAAPVRIVGEKSAVSLSQPYPGRKIWIYDLGQEMAGVPKITLHEKAGTRVTFRYAEVLYPDLPEYAGKVGTMMLENYRDATSTDEYICRGDGEETFQPKFTFHGARYIEISGGENQPSLSDVRFLQYSSIRNFEGSFKSSNALLDRFAQNVFWSQKCNFINIPTDCPQRNERMGWAGDTHVFCHTALNNADLHLFYERVLQAMKDLQTPQGQFPEIAPVGGGFGGITYECASLVIADELYSQYGDVRILEKYYPGMKKYMDYMAEESGLPGEGKFAVVGPLGDWLAPEETDLQLLWNAFYFHEADLMRKFARILGHTEEEKAYAALSQKIRTFWNETFVDPGTKKTRGFDGKICDTQTSYVIGLEYGIMEDTKAAGEHLSRKTEEVRHTVHTGFFGTGLLNRALTDAGHPDDAWQLMLQTDFPSWLYPVTQGATTIWEHWDSFTKEKGFGGQNAMNSFNHYSLGSVLSWMYSDILGITRDPEVPGYHHMILRPQIQDLDFAEGSVSSPYGKISAGWKKEGGKAVYTVTIPVNTKATVILPDGTRKETGSGRKTYSFPLK